MRKLCSTILSLDEDPEREEVTKGSDRGKQIGKGRCRDVYMRMEMSLFIFVKTSILIIYPYN